MKVICKQYITGHCNNRTFWSQCGHGVFHTPMICSGVSCSTLDGICTLTGLAIICLQFTEDQANKLVDRDIAGKEVV